MLKDGFDIVGFVGHEDDRGVGLVRNRQVEVGMAGGCVIDSAEPEAVSVAFDGDVLVDEDRDATGGERIDDQGRVDGDVVVAEDCVTKRAGEGAEDFGATMGWVLAEDEVEGAASDEVSGDEDEVGGQSVDLVDDMLDEEGLGEFVEVDVADLGDAVAAEGVGKVGDVDGEVDDFELVACDRAGV